MCAILRHAVGRTASLRSSQRCNYVIISDSVIAHGSCRYRDARSWHCDRQQIPAARPRQAYLQSGQRRARNIDARKRSRMGVIGPVGERCARLIRPRLSRLPGSDPCETRRNHAGIPGGLRNPDGRAGDLAWRSVEHSIASTAERRLVDLRLFHDLRPENDARHCHRPGYFRRPGREHRIHDSVRFLRTQRNHSCVDPRSAICTPARSNDARSTLSVGKTGRQVRRHY